MWIAITVIILVVLVLGFVIIRLLQAPAENLALEVGEPLAGAEAVFMHQFDRRMKKLLDELKELPAVNDADYPK
ncbi:hypothetical protein Psal006b_00665 [Piscirickettsia salmonis]|uniref:3-phosphoglycerate dehydrogenase n=1 Tax=Piscirickettsia salmonis TaxID=1238 RepID=A0A1L6TE33_PISSA|nr:hypothetical protein [Piscirickettsia salmonis]AKP72782.1 hypothetical protein PSLF89_667 [Piscirickettsia salmonis LF-89 = ATCC VR-1361]ALB23709.1 3-phosphoglycerate dehydrogenase [Piscirickettsia salmonis]ALY03562.1 hypothetical protein AWE47_12465 [Piscirickettsia salmonis]AMA43128.1 hypothetical protein AWJ11_12695 [Piscirickettsia salmonis]AOS35598.1 hypothetical protein AVM72_09820 [Piscirickettsia salmonis]